MPLLPTSISIITPTLVTREQCLWAPSMPVSFKADVQTVINYFSFSVIHFAAYARNMLVPDNECFKGNVLSTYNVIEAACKLGVKKVIIASSETTYGVCFSQGDSDYHSFPLEEDYDCGKRSLNLSRWSHLADYGCGRSNGYLRNKQALWRALRQKFRQEVSWDRHLCIEDRERDRTR